MEITTKKIHVYLKKNYRSFEKLSLDFCLKTLHKTKAYGFRTGTLPFRSSKVLFFLFFLFSTVTKYKENIYLNVIHTEDQSQNVHRKRIFEKEF